MKMNYNTHIAFQLILIAVQFLVPAFVPHMTPDQKTAIAMFISAVQAALGLKAVTQDPEGNPLKLVRMDLKQAWVSEGKEKEPEAPKEPTEQK